MIPSVIRLRELLIVLFAMMLAISCDNADHLSVEEEFVILNEDNKIVKADKSAISSGEQEHIQKIAEKLAVRYVDRKNSEETSIDPAIVNYFYNGLVHLYNSELDEAVTVTDEYTLIAGVPASPREVLVWVDSSKIWLDDSWRAGKTETGISTIDEIIGEFNFELKQYREYSHVSDKVMAEMESDRPLNVYAVGKLFSDLPQIEDAGPDGVLTGGRDIKAEINGGVLLFDVTVGSGDCPSGCINKINHRFRIFSDGRVELDE